jgi:hypothetical protein
MTLLTSEYVVPGKPARSESCLESDFTIELSMMVPAGMAFVATTTGTVGPGVGVGATLGEL